MLTFGIIFTGTPLTRQNIAKCSFAVSSSNKQSNCGQYPKHDWAARMSLTILLLAKKASPDVTL